MDTKHHYLPENKESELFATGVFEKQLKQLKVKLILCDVYRDSINGESLLGYVVDFSEELLCLLSVTETGQYNGISVVRIRDITRLRWGGNSREATEALTGNSSKLLAKAPHLGLDSIEQIIESFNEHYGYVAVSTELLDDQVRFIGSVLEMDEACLLIEEYGTLASQDRHRLLLHTEEITRVDVEDPYALALHNVHQQD